MTTPKKPTETGSPRGEDDPYMEILNSFKLEDKDTRWMDNAKCHTKDGITWFPQQGERHLMLIAKEFCGTCPVRERCLDWALDNEVVYGVWGGRSPAERERTLYARKYKAKMTS